MPVCKDACDYRSVDSVGNFFRLDVRPFHCLYFNEVVSCEFSHRFLSICLVFTHTVVLVSIARRVLYQSDNDAFTRQCVWWFILLVFLQLIVLSAEIEPV